MFFFSGGKNEKKKRKKNDEKTSTLLAAARSAKCALVSSEASRHSAPISLDTSQIEREGLAAETVVGFDDLRREREVLVELS